MDDRILRGFPPRGQQAWRATPPALPLDRRLEELNAQLAATAGCRRRELVLISALADLCGQVDHRRVMEQTVRAAAALAEAACAGLVLAGRDGPGPTPRTWTWAGPEVDGAEAVELEREVVEAVGASTGEPVEDLGPHLVPLVDQGMDAQWTPGEAEAGPPLAQMLMIDVQDEPPGARPTGASGGEVAGWLWVAVPRMGTFDADDAEALTVLAGAAGRALAAVRHFAVVRWNGDGRAGVARLGDDLTVGDLS
jgi:hypothetical protein